MSVKRSATVFGKSHFISIHVKKTRRCSASLFFTLQNARFVAVQFHVEAIGLTGGAAVAGEVGSDVRASSYALKEGCFSTSVTPASCSNTIQSTLQQREAIKRLVIVGQMGFQDSVDFRIRLQVGKHIGNRIPIGTGNARS